VRTNAGRTPTNRPRQSPLVKPARDFYELVALQSSLVSPSHKEHVHLEGEINQQRNNKGRVKAAETCGAKSDGERSFCSVCSVRRPYLTAVIAFPSDVVLSSLQFHNHQGSANCADDNGKRPEEFANADPNVRPVRKRKDVDQRQDSDTQPNASVNVPFWVEEEKVLSFDQEEETSR